MTLSQNSIATENREGRDDRGCEQVEDEDEDDLDVFFDLSTPRGDGESDDELCFVDCEEEIATAAPSIKMRVKRSTSLPEKLDNIV